MSCAPQTRFLPDEAATNRLGGALSAVLRSGDCLMLRGDLGAGKSALSRAIISAALAAEGRREDIPSPSFTLTQTYATRGGEIWHIDLYRLPGPEACDELGLWDAFETAICLVEWPERLGGHLPARRLDIGLDIPARGEGRTLSVDPIGPGWAPALDVMRRI